MSLFQRIANEFTERLAEDYYDVKTLTMTVSRRTYLRLVLEMEIAKGKSTAAIDHGALYQKPLLVKVYGIIIQIYPEG